MSQSIFTKSLNKKALLGAAVGIGMALSAAAPAAAACGPRNPCRAKYSYGSVKPRTHARLTILVQRKTHALPRILAQPKTLAPRKSLTKAQGLTSVGGDVAKTRISL